MCSYNSIFLRFYLFIFCFSLSLTILLCFLHVSCHSINVHYSYFVCFGRSFLITLNISNTFYNFNYLYVKMDYQLWIFSFCGTKSIFYYYFMTGVFFLGVYTWDWIPYWINVIVSMLRFSMKLCTCSACCRVMSRGKFLRLIMWSCGSCGVVVVLSQMELIWSYVN